MRCRRQFITPILENHDPACAAVFLYCARPDAEGGWPGHIAVRPIGAGACALRSRLEVIEMSVTDAVFRQRQAAAVSRLAGAR